ncbi:MAG: phosphotransferase, partial [Woeseia sp.]
QVPENLVRLAALLKTLHGLPPSGVKYDAGIAARNYRTLLRYDVADSALAGLCVQIAESSSQIAKRVCCHNDLVAENIVDNGALKLIDFEYARDNDPYFDLASIINWHNLSSEQAELLLLAYCEVDVDESRERLNEQRRIFDAVQWLWLSLQQQRNPDQWQAEQLAEVADRLSGNAA